LKRAFLKKIKKIFKKSKKVEKKKERAARERAETRCCKKMLDRRKNVW